MNNDYDPVEIPATRWEHMMNTVSVDGQRRPGDAWILTDQDVWVKNPYYRGPAVPHPEDQDPA